MKKQTWQKLFSIFIILAVSLSFFQSASANSASSQPTPQTPPAEIDQELTQELISKGSAGYMIIFRDQADLSAAYDMPWEARGRYVVNALQESANTTQEDVRVYLASQGIRFQSFWIDNIILVEQSSRDTANSLMSFPEIEALRTLPEAILFTPIDEAPAPSPNGIEANLTHVNANDVWALGYTGDGITVANIDTGVRYTHQALVNQYRGNQGGSFDHNYNWWDPYLHTTAPIDSNSHGSHTMGIMLGDDGVGNQIGMAPDAQWIACKSFDGGDVGVQLLECGQFMLAPWDLNHENADSDKRPHIVNNSWGDCSTSYDHWYQGVIDAWLAAGIYPVFSNGNASNCGYDTPPGLNTVGNPARYGNVTGVGATGNHDGLYATYSNWGPTDDPDTVNPQPGWANLKPQVLAPGTSILSSSNGNDSDYETKTGTSMSAPHVSGLIALMWQAAPCLIGDYATTETLIEQSATPIYYNDGYGVRAPNYAAGWGEIDALAAVEAAIDSCSHFRLEVDPISQDRCIPLEVEYQVDVIKGDPAFDQSVALSVINPPSNYTPSFNPNPVTPTASSQLAFQGSPLTSSGSYTFDIIGEALTTTYTKTLGLNLYNRKPHTPILISPSAGSSDIAIPPTFRWNSDNQAALFHFELARETDFAEIIYVQTTQTTTLQADIALEPLTTYYWRAFASNACGDSAWSEINSFSTRKAPPILLVDDDANYPDVSAYYATALDDLGYEYDIWDTGYGYDEPSSVDLDPYEIVIWFTGLNWTNAGPSPSSEDSLRDWLQNGNNLFISSQDYFYAYGLTSFMTNTLGVESISNDADGYTSVTGQGIIFNHFGSHTLSFPFENYSDTITPNLSAQVALIGDNGKNAAIYKDAGDYRSSFWVFPFEALSERARLEAMRTMMNWFFRYSPIYLLMIYK